MEFFLPEVVLAVGALFLINALLLQQNILSKYNRIYSTSSAALIIMLLFIVEHFGSITTKCFYVS
jgi:uncharacterized membrane protein